MNIHKRFIIACKYSLTDIETDSVDGITTQSINGWVREWVRDELCTVVSTCEFSGNYNIRLTSKGRVILEFSLL